MKRPPDSSPAGMLDELRQLITRLPTPMHHRVGEAASRCERIPSLRRCILEGMGIQSNRNIGPLASLTAAMKTKGG